MAVLELPQSHRCLAAALLRRSIFDLTSQGRASVDAWHWFFAEPSGEGAGWDVDDATRVLDLSLPHLRRALIRAGYDRPPSPRHTGPCGKVPGVIPCRRCGEATPSPDIRIQRTCPACGDTLRPKYLRRYGLLSYENGATPPPRAYARAALLQLLRHGPLPSGYVLRQLGRVGLCRRTIERARRDLGLRAYPTAPQGRWLLALPAHVRAA